MLRPLPDGWAAIKTGCAGGETFGPASERASGLVEVGEPCGEIAFESAAVAVLCSSDRAQYGVRSSGLPLQRRKAGEDDGTVWLGTEAGMDISSGPTPTPPGNSAQTRPLACCVGSECGGGRSRSGEKDPRLSNGGPAETLRLCGCTVPPGGRGPVWS